MFSKWQKKKKKIDVDKTFKSHRLKRYKTVHQHTFDIDLTWNTRNILEEVTLHSIHIIWLKMERRTRKRLLQKQSNNYNWTNLKWNNFTEKLIKFQWKSIRRPIGIAIKKKKKKFKRKMNTKTKKKHFSSVLLQNTIKFQTKSKQKNRAQTKVQNTIVFFFFWRFSLFLLINLLRLFCFCSFCCYKP